MHALARDEGGTVEVRHHLGVALTIQREDGGLLQHDGLSIIHGFPAALLKVIEKLCLMYIVKTKRARTAKAFVGRDDLIPPGRNTDHLPQP